jgi:hypothetical protein
VNREAAHAAGYEEGFQQAVIEALDAYDIGGTRAFLEWCYDAATDSHAQVAALSHLDNLPDPEGT